MRRLWSAKSLGMFLLGASLAFGLALSAQILSSAIERYREKNTITVKGYAEKDVASDLASWRCSVRSRDRDMQLAYDELERDLRRVQSFLKAAGCTDEELSVEPVSTSIEYKLNAEGKKTNEIDYYTLSRSCKVDSGRVALVERCARRITDLVADGVEVRSEAPDYVIDDLNTHKLELLATATTNGRQRAQTLAENSGGGVGKLNAASQGVFQIVRRHSTAVSSYGRYDTGSIDKTIKAVVTLEFTTR